jgi:hypothetical protein
VEVEWAELVAVEEVEREVEVVGVAVEAVC